MSKLISVNEATNYIKDGVTLMVGGFLGGGTPNTIIQALVDKGVKDLTLICNDTAFVDKGVGKMVVNKQFSKIIASHIGTNKETGRQLTAGETEVELVPQGTLAERIRAAGFGLGGILTPTGVGTIVEDGKRIIEQGGKKYILERPLRADVAILHGSAVDKAGNVFHKKTTRNCNPIMAMAADIVIVEAEEVVEIGEIDPHLVITPATLVDYIVKGEK
jgi:acetate CoA/acetoacetate CoA-transferase alpha subunit